MKKDIGISQATTQITHLAGTRGRGAVQRGGLPGEAVVPGPASPGTSAASPGPGLSRPVVPSRGLGAGLAGVRGGDVHGGTLLQIARVVASVLHMDVLLDGPIFLNEKTKTLNIMESKGI